MTRSLRRAEPAQTVVETPNGLGDRHDPQPRRAEPIQAVVATPYRRPAAPTCGAGSGGRGNT